MWSRWRLSTLLYFLSLSERILGEIQQILKKSNRTFCHILGYIFTFQCASLFLLTVYYNEVFPPGLFS
jgi:hypothetical protein